MLCAVGELITSTTERNKKVLTAYTVPKSNKNEKHLKKIRSIGYEMYAILYCTESTAIW